MFYLDLFRALDQHQVRYLLVGGLALNIHGVERATMDVDLLVALDDDNLDAFLKAACALGLMPVLPVDIKDLVDSGKRSDWIENKHMMAFPLRAADIYAPTVDVLIQSGLDFAEAWARRIEKEVSGTIVRLVCMDDLMKMKTDTGRLRDDIDVAMLKRLRQLGLE